MLLEYIWKSTTTIANGAYALGLQVYKTFPFKDAASFTVVSAVVHNAPFIPKGPKAAFAGVEGYLLTDYLTKTILETEVVKSKVSKPIRDASRHTVSVAGGIVALCYFAGMSSAQIAKLPYLALVNSPKLLIGPFSLAGGLAGGYWLGGKIADKYDFDELDKSRLQFSMAAGLSLPAMAAVKPIVSVFGSISTLSAKGVSSYIPSIGEKITSAPNFLLSAGSFALNTTKASALLLKAVVVSPEAWFLGTNMAIATSTFLATQYAYENFISEQKSRHDLDSAQVGASVAGIVTLTANWHWMKAAANMGLYESLKVATGYTIGTGGKILSVVSSAVSKPVGFLGHYGGKMAKGHLNFISTAAHGNLLTFMHSMSVHYVLPLAYMDGLDMPYIGFEIIEGMDRKTDRMTYMKAEIIAIEAVKSFKERNAEFLAKKAQSKLGLSDLMRPILSDITKHKRQNSKAKPSEFLSDDDFKIYVAHESYQLAQLYQEVTGFVASKDKNATISDLMSNPGKYIKDADDQQAFGNIQRLIQMSKSFALRDDQQSINKLIEGNTYFYLRQVAEIAPYITLLMPTGPVFAICAISTVAYCAFSAYDATIKDQIKDSRITYAKDPGTIVNKVIMALDENKRDIFIKG